jgi:hypothetical protein
MAEGAADLMIDTSYLSRRNPRLYQGAYWRGFFAAYRQQGKMACPWDRQDDFSQAMRSIFANGFNVGLLLFERDHPQRRRDL